MAPRSISTRSSRRYLKRSPSGSIRLGKQRFGSGSSDVLWPWARPSTPCRVPFAAIPERGQPQAAQGMGGGMEPPRRPRISDPIIDLWSKVNWVIPKPEEQQKAFFDLIIPHLDHYVTPEAIAAITDAGRRTEV